MPLIKRYPNRKLYRTEAKRYITLEEIASLVQAGQDVQIVDHETGGDLTDVTLAQIIFAQARQRATSFSRTVLAHLIRAGGMPSDTWQRELESSIGVLLAEGELSPTGAERLRELLAPAQPEEVSLSAIVEHRFQTALSRLNLPSQADVGRLRAQLDELARRLEELDSQKKTELKEAG